MKVVSEVDVIQQFILVLATKQKNVATRALFLRGTLASELPPASQRYVPQVLAHADGAKPLQTPTFTG